MALFDSAKHGYAGLCAASQCLVPQGLAQHQELRLLRAQSPWVPQSTWCWGRGRQVTPGLASDFQGPQSIWPQLLLNTQGLDAFTNISEAPRWTPVLTGRALGSREPRSLPSRHVTGLAAPRQDRCTLYSAFPPPCPPGPHSPWLTLVTLPPAVAPAPEIQISLVKLSSSQALISPLEPFLIHNSQDPGGEGLSKWTCCKPVSPLLCL